MYTSVVRKVVIYTKHVDVISETINVTRTQNQVIRFDLEGAESPTVKNKYVRTMNQKDSWAVLALVSMLMPH